jgi:predicted permease
MLRRSPGFSLLVILCLTLGIGANAAVFSWIEGILLRPFPKVVDQDRMLVLTGIKPGESHPDSMSWPDFLDLQRNSTLIESFIADKITGSTLNIGDRAERVAASIVSSNYFNALGIHLLLGHGFDLADQQGRNAHPVTVISYWLWMQRFHGDRDVIGKTQMLNGVPHTIVGVAPEGFYGTFVGYPIEFWVPISMQEVFEPGGYKLENRNERWIEGFVLPKRGVTARQAEQELATIAKRLEVEYPATNRGRGIKLFPLWKDPFNGASEQLPVMKLSSAAVLILLLIVCANVSNLLLVRSFARRREIIVRLAVGAGRRRLLKQLFTEGLILSTFAAIGGILVAYSCRNLVALLLPPTGGVAVNLPGNIDVRVLALSIGITLLSTLLFSLIPAIQNSHIDLASALKSESGAVFGSRGKSRLRSALLLLQMAFSFVLLVGSVLLIESVHKIRTADPGFSTQNVLTSTVNLVTAGYDEQRAKSFREALVDRVQAIAGVESAAYSRIRPFTYSPYPSARIAVDGYQPRSDELPSVEYNQVDPRYLETMGIALLSGRDFTRADNEKSLPVVIVNEKMVDQYWRGQDPVGKRLQVEGRSLRVIGVAKLSKYGELGEAPRPFFYIPMRQGLAIRSGIINIRTSLDAGLMAAALARVVHELDANLAPTEVITMREQVNRYSLRSQQIAVSLLGIFGTLALLLAAIGFYGVMSHTVNQSTRELGLRIALGASAKDVLQLVFRQGFFLTAAGVLIGSATALFLTRFIAALLYQVNPRDPLAFACAFAVLSLTSVAAVLLPARHAAKTDPARVLRE